MFHSSTGIALVDLPEHSANENSMLYTVKSQGEWYHTSLSRYISISSAYSTVWVTNPSDHGKLQASKRLYGANWRDVPAAPDSRNYQLPQS